MKRYTGATDMDTLTEISEAHGVNLNISPEMAKKMLLSHIKLQDSKIDSLIAALKLAEDCIDPRSHGWKHYLESKERKLVEPLLKGE